MYSREVVYSLCTKLLTNQNGSRFVDLQPHFHFSGKFQVLLTLGESEEKGTMIKEPGSMMTQVNSGSSNGITLWAMELGEEQRGLVTCVPNAPTSTTSIQPFTDEDEDCVPNNRNKKSCSTPGSTGLRRSARLQKKVQSRPPS